MRYVVATIAALAALTGCLSTAQVRTVEKVSGAVDVFCDDLKDPKAVSACHAIMEVVREHPELLEK